MASPVAFRNDWWIKTTTGAAIVGAHVYWLNQPATVPSGEPAGGPTGQATTYVDTTGTTQQAQPVVTDAFGHVDVYLLPGFYTVAIYVNSVLYASYTDQFVSGVGVTSLNGLSGAVVLTPGSNMQVNVAGQQIQLNALSGFPANALTGDILMFNAQGDGNWDAVNMAQPACGVIANQDGIALVGFTPGNATFINSSGVSANNVFPTNNSYFGINYFNFGAGASANSLGFAAFISSSTGLCYLGLLSFHRLTFKLANTLTAGCRYWHGLSVYYNLSTIGNNSVVPVGTTAYVTATPNKSTIGFRYDPAVDSTWKAVCVTAGASPAQTTVDTGVTPVTNTPAIFDIIPNATGTSINFYINYVNVATISTNIPPVNLNNDSLCSIFVSGDNNNVAHQVGFTIYSAYMSMKGQQAGL